MSIHSLAEHRERHRAAADAVFSQVERELREARDTIMASALRRLAQADPQLTIEPAVERLGQIWIEAWPYGPEDPQ